MKDRGFVEAGELEVGEELLDTRGNVLYVEESNTEILNEPVKVYNFQVEEYHTYHVGESGILVHNADSSYAGPGTWEKTNESMSDESRQYQKYVTGANDGMVYKVDGVKFDGFKNGVLLEAKGNYSNFVNKNTDGFYTWFKGKDSLLNQALNQVDAANGIQIQWHFNDATSMNVIKDLLKEISGIEFVFNPMK